MIGIGCGLSEPHPVTPPGARVRTGRSARLRSGRQRCCSIYAGRGHRSQNEIGYSTATARSANRPLPETRNATVAAASITANINVPLGPMFDLSRCCLSSRSSCASCPRSPLPCACRLSSDFTALRCWQRRVVVRVRLASSTTSLAFPDDHKGVAISSGRALFRRLNMCPPHSPSSPGLTRSMAQTRPTGQEGVKQAVCACCAVFSWTTEQNATAQSHVQARPQCRAACAA